MQTGGAVIQTVCLSCPWLLLVVVVVVVVVVVLLTESVALVV